MIDETEEIPLVEAEEIPLAKVEQTPTAEIEETPFAGCLVRLFSLFVGYAGLAMFLVVIAVHDQGLLSFASVGFWVVVGLLMVARFVSVTQYKGIMSDGTTPATVRDATRFSAGLVIVAGVLWAAAHALGSRSLFA